MMKFCGSLPGLGVIVNLWSFASVWSIRLPLAAFFALAVPQDANKWAPVYNLSWMAPFFPLT
jgi:hypothetical protein